MGGVYFIIAQRIAYLVLIATFKRTLLSYHIHFAPEIPILPYFYVCFIQSAFGASKYFSL